VLDAVEHGELPFAEVSDHLSLHGVDRLQLFDTSFEAREHEPTRLKLDGVTAAPFAESWLTSGPTHFSAASLAVEVQFTDKGIGGRVRYHPSAVDRATAGAIGVQLWRVLTRAGEDPHAALHQLTSS
jgi:hypothetical protein